MSAAGSVLSSLRDMPPSSAVLPSSATQA